jgi:hypothetical protein
MAFFCLSFLDYFSFADWNTFFAISAFRIIDCHMIIDNCDRFGSQTFMHSRQLLQPTTQLLSTMSGKSFALHAIYAADCFGIFEITFFGQAFRHSPQSVHFFSFMLGNPLIVVIAFTGQTMAQSPKPRQACSHCL